MAELTVILEDLQNTPAEDRNEFRFEPRIAFEPKVVARAWMRQGNGLRPKLTPRLNHLGE